jgi:hypothetical protein
MTVEVENKDPAVGFLDPECLFSTTLNSTDNTLTFSVSYMLNAFKLYAKKNLMLIAYLSTNHWIAVASFRGSGRSTILIHWRQLILVLTLSSESLMSEGPIKRPEGGRSEWEPIKIYLKRWTRIYPKIYSKPEHTRWRRDRQGHTVTTNLQTLGVIFGSTSGSTNQRTKALNQSCEPEADCPQGWGGLSARTQRTIRNFSPNLQ